MKFLVVRDELTTRLILHNVFKKYGEIHVAANGKESAEAVKASLEDEQPYSLITLNVVMAGMDGYETLKSIRNLEAHFGVLDANRTRIIMTTSFEDCKSSITLFNELCDGFLMKPIDRKKLLKHLEMLPG